MSKREMFRLRGLQALATVFVLLMFTALLSVGQWDNTQGEVPFVPTPHDVVEAMLDLANVTSKDVVYDLGSGDGRIVVTAAKKYGARGVGVDINPERIREGEENARKEGVANRVRFVQQDLFKADISEATVVTLYLLSSVNLRLRPKLMEELRPGTRIVSQTFDMGDWKPEKEIVVDGRNVYLWTIPPRSASRSRD